MTQRRASVLRRRVFRSQTRQEHNVVSLMIVVAVALVAWLVVSLPLALVIGRISRNAEDGSTKRIPAGAFIVGTGAIGSITR